jgi:predicted MPP superfamily phosphohydrolase
MINYIIHLSDIHIRSGSYIKSRYEQYLYTFNNLLEEIKNLNIPFEECICVITGDIFHFKNNADSTGIQLFNYLIDGIAKYYRIYLIQGNHDFKQDCLEEPDILSSLFFKNPRENVFYLNKTDIYNIDNLVIGCSVFDCSVFDSSIFNNSINNIMLLSLLLFPNDYNHFF